MRLLESLAQQTTTARGIASTAVLALNEHDCGDANCTVIESDYYFLEALRRMRLYLRAESASRATLVEGV